MLWKIVLITILTIADIHSARLSSYNENANINFRLPNNTIPENYTISLRSWIHDGNFSFTGIVTIDLVAVQTSNFITIHQDGFIIGDIRLWSNDDPINIGAFEYNSTLDFLTIPILENLNAEQRYQLRIEYSGILRDDDLGFYRSSYVNDLGVTVWLAATQFQTASARRAFPCYDEPGLKATFKVDITHDPSYEALANMPDVSKIENDDGSVTTHFLNSPPMSTYLVAFVVSEFPHLQGNLSHPTLLRVYARPTAINQSKFIFDLSEPMLDNMNSYFGVNYSLPKLDQIALPDFRYGAMENYGLITYLELLFLYDENQSDYIVKTGVMEAIAHEFGHQWFGNLVSPSWWTYMWLNEGFASYFQNIAINMMFPDWDMIDYFNVRSLQNIFQPDALDTSPPMNMFIEHADDVTGLFSQMTSTKAACVIQMFLHAFTESTFLKGIEIYLNELAYGIASEEDIFRALETAVREDNAAPEDIDVATVMGSWTGQAGFPLLVVQRNYAPESDQQTISLSQERYFTNLSNNPNNITWWIPVNYATAQVPSFHDTRASIWYPPMTNLNFSVPNLNSNDWLIINKQATGYYRILYDETNYRLLSDALVRNVSLFHKRNRAQLIDDTYNFVRSDLLSYSTFFDIVRFLENDHEFAPWHPAITAFTALDRLFSGHVDYPLFRAFVRQLTEHLYDTLGPRDISDEPHLRKYARTIAINWACNMGSVHCRSDTTRELRSLMVSGLEFHQNVRNVLYCAALRSGDTRDFNFIWSRMLSSNDTNSRNLLITALGCSTSQRLLRELVRSVVPSTNDNKIVYRDGEQARVFNSIYQSGLTGLEIALNFVVDNMHEVFFEFGFTSFENLIIGMSQRVSPNLQDKFTNLLNTAYYESLIAAHIPLYANLYMDDNKQWLESYGSEVSRWLRANYVKNFN